MFSFLWSKKKLIKDAGWIGVDMHSHLLPGIDDGVQDAATGATFIEELLALGYRRFICTPHVYDEVHPNTPFTIESSRDLLQKELNDRGMEVPLSASAEYMMSGAFPSLLAEDMLLPQPNNYLLVEMSYIVETANVEQLLFDISIKGYKPILAHPERYAFYFQNRNRINALKESGCLLQLNLLSPTGYYGKEVAKMASHLIKQGLYDLVGTDLHHQKHLDRIKQYVLSGKAYEDLHGLSLMNTEIYAGCVVRQ
ncbi:tyrosine-protein phosphatase [Olivibacter sitiensis]|uniref:tyrosine-protein phosphatase n=1 Tax=Olivibacter sitiensis TaxID=376470 RepID=UPI00041C003E|nr:CpsB/CapC family capsule biosynthesis tyrosine phosphatase [Olivibacter sitiensis]